MRYTFFVIDDDLACRRILAQIIEDEGLGEVVGELSDGSGDVAGTIIGRQPDVVLIDLLMPGKDGIEIVEQLRASHFPGKIVMISQVEKKEMVAQAYAAGIEFYINKPVNRIEVISVIKRVLERLEMELSFARMRDSIAALDYLNNVGPAPSASALPLPEQEEKIIGERVREILADMGVIGEPGSHDLVQIILFLSNVPDVDKYLGEYRHLKELYQAVQQKYLEAEKHSDVRAIEQRVRRAVKHAMDNIAALGLDDFYNPVFERYSAKFFDFNELRLKMKELEQGQVTPTRARVNIKQFINALYWEVIR
ncbi:MAG TPA: response regulator [Bacillota bacterium]|nr:response regulator [Bacillota bacterium]